MYGETTKINDTLDSLSLRITNLEQNRIAYDMPRDIKDNIQRAIIFQPQYIGILSGATSPVTEASPSFLQMSFNGQLYNVPININITSGTGAPIFNATKGTIYSNNTATTPSTRLYVNTDGGTTWAAFTTTTGIVNVISGSGATVALTLAQAGSIVLMDRAAGIVFTLPSPTVGMTFSFYASASVTTNNYKIITSAGTIFLAGSLVNIKTDLTTLFSIGDNATYVAVTMNGTTTGGLVGTYLKFTCTTATQWTVEGNNLASGAIATPFTTS